MALTNSNNSLSYIVFCTRSYYVETGKHQNKRFIPFRKPECSKTIDLYSSEKRNASKHVICSLPKTGKLQNKRFILFRKPECFKTCDLYSSENRNAPKHVICSHPKTRKLQNKRFIPIVWRECCKCGRY